MRRFVIIILVLLCWSIVPIYATIYHTNGGAAYGVLNNGYGNPYSHNYYYSGYKTSSQSPTMTMRSTSRYSVNPYSMPFGENDRMQESGIQSYGLMNMNGNYIYCPGSAIQGIAPDENTENNLSSYGPRRVTSNPPGVDPHDHYLYDYDFDTDMWTCSKCGKSFTTQEVISGTFPWCEVPLEFDWKVIAFMAGLLAVYAYIKKTDLTSNSDVRNGCDMLA